MKKEYVSPEIMEISSLKDSYCSLDDILSSFGNEFSDNAGDSIVDTDFD